MFVACNTARLIITRFTTALKVAAHEATALFVNAPHGAAEIALGPSSTAMTFRLSAAFARMWGPGTAVVVSELDVCDAMS